MFLRSFFSPFSPFSSFFLSGFHYCINSGGSSDEKLVNFYLFVIDLFFFLVKIISLTGRLCNDLVCTFVLSGTENMWSGLIRT